MTKTQEKLVIKAAMSFLGSKTSAAKTDAARKNGKLGGRGNKKGLKPA
jgi:hypothetical protein